MAGEEASGSTAYVTLEPCSHTGKTGPCALALIEAGVSHVVIAALDPNPLVAGNGVRLLEEAGISVETGICEQESLRLNDVFNYSITHQLPFVTLKTAISLDGKIATKTGSSKWVTSAEARKEVHQLRTEHQAILVGVETVLKDDPALTARIPNGRNPIRVIVDSNLRTPLDAQVSATKKHQLGFSQQQIQQMKANVPLLNNVGSVLLSRLARNKSPYAKYLPTYTNNPFLPPYLKLVAH